VATITFKVCEIRQGASGGSSVVGYTADVELSDDPNTIEIFVLSTIPSNADAGFIEHAVEHTRQGFAEALKPLKRGATVRLTDLLLHDVDYKPHRQRACSASHLAAALGSLTTGCS